MESIEALSLRFDPLNEANATTLQDTDAGGASFAGMPIGIRFSRPIPDLPAFCEELFSSRAPYRLWGQPAVAEDEALVEAVDLHVGQRIGIELGRDWIRVNLHAGSCGNQSPASSATCRPALTEPLPSPTPTCRTQQASSPVPH